MDALIAKIEQEISLVEIEHCQRTCDAFSKNMDLEYPLRMIAFDQN